MGCEFELSLHYLPSRTASSQLFVLLVIALKADRSSCSHSRGQPGPGRDKAGSHGERLRFGGYACPLPRHRQELGPIDLVS
jgi:hypothetical protein